MVANIVCLGVEVKQKVLLITGVTSGIGLAIAREMAAQKMFIVGCGRRLNRLQELEREMQANGFGFKGIECDLRQESDILRMFQYIRQEYGGVDILINNAGLGHQASLLSGKTEDWLETLQVNVLALSICTREAVQDMRTRGDNGYVIHISSMSAHRVPSGSAMYSASKFAVRALTEALRQELRAINSQIRVTALSPGFVETEFAEHYAKSKERATEVYSRYKVLEARDIAKQVSFLLSTPVNNIQFYTHGIDYILCDQHVNQHQTVSL